jgi:DNA-3-methyladenine glycosylase II
VLSGRDTDLRRVVQRLGPPPMWARRPGFATLVYIILEQQVSLASAKATYDKLRHRLTRLTPRAFLALDAATLKRCGFSRQKTEYCRQLANSILQRQLVLRRLERADDSTAKAELIQIKGIGSWSADIYLLMALLRPDVWPSGDLALASAVRTVKGLASVPTPDELDRIGRPWRPWRAVAARILWHHYLSRRRDR